MILGIGHWTKVEYVHLLQITKPLFFLLLNHMVDDYCTFDDRKWKEKSHKQLSQKNIIDEHQLPYLKGIHFLDLKEDNGRIVDVMEEF